VPVKVVLEVFNAETKTYTDSAVDAQCYKAGNSCPEAHVVCKPEYCEMDVWKTIIADFKAASPGKVSVLGSVGVGTTSSEYFGLAVDGIYFVGTDTVSTVAKRGSICSSIRRTLRLVHTDPAADQPLLPPKRRAFKQHWTTG
jgi:hypothetical protein